jgi:hypothetical protein
MTARTLAFITSALLFAPLLATDALAQRPIGARPPVVDPWYGRDDGGGPDRGRNDRYDYERARLRERLGAQAYRDGYEAGLRAGRSNRRFDLSAESRFRNSDRGYKREFGPREQYRFFYRDAFRDGYERGYQEGIRLNRRGPGFSIWWGR